MRWTVNASTVDFMSEISNRTQKEQVANSVATKVKDGDVIGAGSGSTSFLALQAIGKRVQAEKLQVTMIPTSAEVELVCGQLGLPTTSLIQARPDWGFDGADEVDPAHSLIKGRGGAMFKEKLVIASAPLTYILVDPSKLVQTLGQKFPVPVEVYPMALPLVETRLSALGATTLTLRPAKGKDGPIVTETGNFILDAHFHEIDTNLEKEIKAIPGVIESGLFIGYPVEILIAQ
ncbi:MAG: ribose 5-phosphate isomerase A [Chloroflexota bacterium]